MTRVQRVSTFQGYQLWAESYDGTPNPVAAMDARHSVRVLSPAPGELVLDAGCGTGRNLQAILASGARAVGLDFSPAMLRVAQRRQPGAQLAVADLQRPLPFADASFDAVLCALVGEHLVDLAATLSELRRVLKVGGRLVFSVYHPDLAAAGVEANFEQDGTEYRLPAFGYTLEDYLEGVVAAGFPDLLYREYRGDAQMARDVPASAKYVGFPVLLLIAALAG